MIKIGDEVTIKKGHFKNRTGKIVDSMIYNDKKKYKIVLENFNDIPMWFYEDEIRRLYYMIGLVWDYDNFTYKNHG